MVRWHTGYQGTGQPYRRKYEAVPLKGIDQWQGLAGQGQGGATDQKGGIPIVRLERALLHIRFRIRWFKKNVYIF